MSPPRLAGAAAARASPPSYGEFLRRVLSRDVAEELESFARSVPSTSRAQRKPRLDAAQARVLADIKRLLQPTAASPAGAIQAASFFTCTSLDEKLIPRRRRPWSEAARSLTASSAAEVIEEAVEITSVMQDELSGSGIELLRDLGCSDAQLHEVARKCPAILLLPLDKQTYELLSVLVSAGLCKDDLKAIFVADPLLLRRDPDRVLTKIEFLSSVGLASDGIVALLRAAPYVLHVRASTLRENFDLLLSFGFPRPAVLRLLQTVPRVFTGDTGRLAARLEFLSALGMSSAQVAAAASRQGDLLTLDFESTVAPKLEALRAFGFREEDVRRALVAAPQLAAADVERHLREKEAVLEELAGLSRPECARVFANAPSALLHTPANLRSKLEALQSAGFSRPQLRRLLLGCPRLLVLCPSSNILPKLAWLRRVAGVGLGEVALALSLRARGARLAQVTSIANALGMSLERRLAPRHAFLRARGRLPAPGEPVLSRICRHGDEEWARAIAGAADGEYAAWRAAAPRAALGLPEAAPAAEKGEDGAEG